jgi:hypothetical protein
VTETLTPAESLARARVPVFANESEAYARARQALLAEEIDLRRHLTRVVDQRRALPMARIAACTTCSAITTRWSPISGCTGLSANGPARCAPTGSAR